MIDNDLRRHFGSSARASWWQVNRMRVNRYLGREGDRVIAPAIARSRAKHRGVGPFPADTLFTRACAATGYVALAMFHDQGLPVLKHAAFGEAVNVTLGLPMIRTR